MVLKQSSPRTDHQRKGCLNVRSTKHFERSNCDIPDFCNYVSPENAVFLLFLWTPCTTKKEPQTVIIKAVGSNPEPSSNNSPPHPPPSSMSKQWLRVWPPPPPPLLVMSDKLRMSYELQVCTHKEYNGSNCVHTRFWQTKSEDFSTIFRGPFFVLFFAST